MVSLLIRNLDVALHAQLKARAADHGRSLGDEAREVLREAIARAGATEPKTLDILAARLFGPAHGFDLDLAPRDGGPDRAPPDFGTPGR